MGGRVLFVSGEYPPMHGGIGDYTARLADALDEQGWETLVMTSSQVGHDAGDRVVARVNRWDSRIVDVVRETLQSTSADVLHIQYQTGAFQMRPSINLLPLRLGFRNRPVPVVTTYHDLLRPYLFPKAGMLRQWVNRSLAIGSDAIILTNERDYRQVSSYNWFRDRAHRIPLGSNIPRVGDVDRDKVLKRHDLDPGGFVVGFFGFLMADKGIGDLLDALERPDMDGTQLLVISGELATTDASNRKYWERTRKRLADSGVAVKVTGYLTPEEVAEALAAADVLALPYRFGASLRSGTLLSALQSGTPVITTDPRPGDSLSPYAPGESIWLVPVSEPDFLHEAIHLLRQEPSLRERLGKNAVASSCAFEWPVIAERHSDVYRKLIDA